MNNKVNKNITFLGAGNMAEALINGFIKSGLVAPEKITASDVRNERSLFIKKKYKIKTAGNIDAVKNADIIFIAVKPKNVKELLGQVSWHINKEQILISIAAGITTGTIETLVSKKLPVIRVMPNTPALVGSGAIGISSGKYAKKEHLNIAVKLFLSVGAVVVLNEEKLDAVTAVSGSGPAYVFYLSEVMEKAAVSLGLSKDVSKLLVHQTILGAGKMLSGKDVDAAALRRNVTSPGGTTEAAINYLQANKFEKTIVEAIEKACKRSKELRKQS